MRAAVVVAGDLGRSPRMQYHAHALAASGVDVDVIGYQGRAAPEVPDRRPAHPRPPASRAAVPLARRPSKILYGLLAFVDAMRASVRLGAALMRIPSPNLVLVQNPPAFPTLHVAWFVRRGCAARDS